MTRRGEDPDPDRATSIKARRPVSGAFIDGSPVLSTLSGLHVSGTAAGTAEKSPTESGSFGGAAVTPFPIAMMASQNKAAEATTFEFLETTRELR